MVLNGLITQHRSELESVIGATIVSGGIDMCKYTMCDQGCQTIHLANEVNFACFVKSTILNKVLVLVLFRSKVILFGVVYCFFFFRLVMSCRRIRLLLLE